jgi:predicted kinase
MVGIPGSGKTEYVIGEYVDDGTVWFDATNTRRDTRRALLAIGNRYRIGVEVVVMVTPIGVCLQRNATRLANRRVPEGTIARMYESLMASIDTIEKEGFVDVWLVRGQ